jgi:glutathione S-transferase
MITLHHAPQSRSSRIIWLLEEVGATYQIAFSDIPRIDGSGASDPNNPHPDKKVPALVDDGVLVTESSAIVLYLTDKFPAAGIGVPIGDPQRGPYLSWLAWYAGVVEPVVTLGFAGLADHPHVQRSFRGPAEIGERVLAALRANPYLLGARFTGADLLFASMAQWVRSSLPADARVDAVMSTPVLTVEAEADLDEAFTLLRHNMVRRLAVVSRGEFKGTVAIDDLMVHVANDLTSLVRPVVAEMLWAHRDSRAPATT